ncbi:MAG: hypothetical protein H6R15_4318 [Proteobacteria bacterium]|nr:hypothetical protein [Pseudomonadota bacterium]
MPVLDDDEFAAWAADLKEWPSVSQGFVADGVEWEWAVGLSVSLYFHVPPEVMIEKRLAAIRLWQEYQALIGNQLTHVGHPKGGRLHKIGSKRVPDFIEHAQKLPLDENFFIESASSESEVTSANYTFRSWIRSYWEEVPFKLSWLRLDFAYSWWRDHRDALHAFVLKAATQMNAEQGYMGFGYVNPLGVGAAGDILPYEKQLARRFYGYHFDKPFYMDSPHAVSRPLTFGMNAPTWGTLIGTRWLEKAGGKAAVRAQLTHPRIRVSELPDALWIEAGEEPGLLPVEDGIPPIYGEIARALKPARADDLDFLTLGQWDDDERDVMTPTDSQAWLARFDPDGSWPSPDVRFWQPDPQAGIGLGIESKRRPSIPGGAPCPESGWWFTPAQAGSRRYFKSGETMPSLGGDYGLTFWQWSPDQSAPKL